MTFYIAWSESFKGSGRKNADGILTRTWLGAWWHCWWRRVFTGTDTWIEKVEP